MRLASRVTTALGTPAQHQPVVRRVFQAALGGGLLFAGTGHLTFARATFRAQVPTWFPMEPDTVVLASGVVELALGGALVLLVGRARRVAVGWVVAAFFVAVFPGNISQLVTHTDAFGLDTDTSRAVRLVFQPVLVAWALWSTEAWRSWRRRSEQAAGAPAA
jgi:uncharacterized membrane protein